MEVLVNKDVVIATHIYIDQVIALRTFSALSSCSLRSCLHISAHSCALHPEMWRQQRPAHPVLCVAFLSAQHWGLRCMVAHRRVFLLVLSLQGMSKTHSCPCVDYKQRHSQPYPLHMALCTQMELYLWLHQKEKTCPWSCCSSSQRCPGEDCVQSCRFSTLSWTPERVNLLLQGRDVGCCWHLCVLTLSLHWVVTELLCFSLDSCFILIMSFSQHDSLQFVSFL